jgi:catechol 2,3-dioxygenase-like lactoylglutathione lyase family enzyme
MTLRRLEHLLVLTDDLEATKAFYCDALGLEAGERPPLEFPGYWLYLDGVPCVHVAERAPYEAHAARLGLGVGPAPVDHVAFAAARYDRLVERLEAAGVEAVPNTVPSAGLRQLFLTDPNGVRIELNFRTGTSSPSPAP